MSGEAVVERFRSPAQPGRSLAWWGMAMTILTEGMLLALLLFVYFYLYSLADQWPLGDIPPPELRAVTVRTVLLLASSGTMTMAARGLRRGRRRLVQVLLLLTFALGAVFLAGHIEEMLRLPSEFTWSTNAYGSLFYVIVNFHGVHLAVGLLFLAFSYAALVGGRYTATEHEGFEVTGMYWHFVDTVWVFVYPTVYLVPNLLPK